IATLIPEQVRGRYLVREAACVSTASFVTFLLAAACLGEQPKHWQFAILIAFSATMGAISLAFLKRIPDVPIPSEPQVRSLTHVPWLAMAKFPPFRKLLRTVVSWSVAYGGMTAFSVAFLKSELHLGEGFILLLNSFFFLGGLGSLWLLGSRLDHLGSKPVLTFCFGMWVLVSVGWSALAGRAVIA